MFIGSISHTSGSQRVRIHVRDTQGKTMSSILEHVENNIPVKFLDFFRADCIHEDAGENFVEVTLTLKDKVY